MIIFRNYKRKKEAWNEGVAHVTLDPSGPGVARLHLVPPKPTLFMDPPSQLIINGTWFLPVGHSWASILRVFFKELQHYCKAKSEISPEEICLIEKAVVDQVSTLYSNTSKELILNDLHEIVSLAVNIATNQEIPKETQLGLNLEQYSKYMTAPHRIDLVVAPMSIQSKRACPLNCVCCYADSGQMMDIPKQLTTQDWKSIIDKCKEANIPMLTFTGGEPLTRPDIVELVEHAQWFVTRLNTSAYLLTLDLAQKLFEASLDGIQITLYSSEPNIHDALVGKEGAWNKTVEGIKNALKAGLSVSVNTPLVEKNKDYTNTLRFVYELGIRCVGCSGLIPTGGAVEQIHTGKTLTPSELKSVLQEAVTLCNELSIDISFTSPGWLSREEIGALGLPSAPICGACLSNMAIAPTGDVVPCQSWLGGLTLGNMLTNSWKTIWNSSACKHIRNSCAGKPACGLKEV